MKKQSGGYDHSKIVSIIATHQSRIRCLLSDILGIKIERFMNGAVLRLEIKEHTLSCSLVHQGELNEDKPNKKYYVTDKGTTGKGKLIQEDFPTIKDRSHNYDTMGKPFVFFLIRHGQGVHNTLKGIKKILGDKDPRLTNEGKQQAKNTGKAMINNSEYKREFSEAKYLFSSDLKRTIQTLVNIVNVFNEYTQNKIVNNVENAVGSKKIIVLPCNHELNYDKKGSCDGALKQSVIGNENKTSCNYSKSGCVSLVGDFEIDWSLYRDFYGEGTRLNPGKNNRRHCRNTNFLQEAINFISPENNTNIASSNNTNNVPKNSTNIAPNNNTNNPSKNKITPEGFVLVPQANKGGKRRKSKKRHNKKKVVKSRKKIRKKSVYSRKKNVAKRSRSRSRK